MANRAADPRRDEATSRARRAEIFRRIRGEPVLACNITGCVLESLPLVGHQRMDKRKRSTSTVAQQRCASFCCPRPICLPTRRDRECGPTRTDRLSRDASVPVRHTVPVRWSPAFSKELPDLLSTNLNSNPNPSHGSRYGRILRLYPSKRHLGVSCSTYILTTCKKYVLLYHLFCDRGSER